MFRAFWLKIPPLKPHAPRRVKIVMNTNNSTLVSRHNLVPAGVIVAALAALALLAPPAARADLRVGVSLGVDLPRGYTEVVVGRDHYYESHGVFYQRGPHGYFVVRAPRGAIVRVLPPHYVRIYVGRDVYYRYGDIYYRETPGGYVIVDAPTAESLPPPRPVEGYQSFWAGEKEYLFRNGQFFIKTPEGTVWVEAPLGAVSRDLPPDVQSVWYQGTEYFENDEVYFKKTPDGYQVVAAPWKK